MDARREQHPDAAGVGRAQRSEPERSEGDVSCAPKAQIPVRSGGDGHAGTKKKVTAQIRYRARSCAPSSQSVSPSREA